MKRRLNRPLNARWRARFRRVEWTEGQMIRAFDASMLWNT